MALQVWLPLNEDLHNQGLSNAIVTSEGTITIDSNGKIGKCYKFGTEKGRLTFPVSVMKNFTNACSIAFWIKINTWNTNYATIFQCGLGGTAWTAYRFGILRNNNNKLHLAISDGTNSYYSLATNDLTLGQWYHICFTYTTGKCSCYVNGIFLRSGNTTVVPAFNGATVATIGAINASGGYQCDMYLNDLRIYDNCLSAEEVAEIAKGLVLHYPLNNNGFGNENLIANSKQGGSWGYASSGYDRYAPITLVVPDKDVYTLSFEAKSTVKGDKMRTHYYSPNTTTTCISSQGITKTASDGNMDFTLTTTWAKYWVTYHQSATTAVKHVICPRLMEGQGTGTVSVRNVKFEEGSVATSWSPAKTDALYTTMKVNDSIEHDISGYGNDGTITGTLETIGSGPKGTATKFGEYQSPQIYVSDPTSLIPELTSCTLSWWEKCTDSGAKSLPFVGQDGNYYIAAGSATTRLYDQNIGTPTVYRDGIATTGQTMSGKSVYHPNIFHTYNEWHHFVYTNVDFSTWTKFRINSYGTTWPVNAYLSDVRIYATPLTADQVAQLYKDSMVVDSSGNITPRDLE